jgi:PmbA protein
VTVEEKIDAIETLLAAVRSNWPLATTILNASYAEASPWIGLVNSHGFAAVYPTTSCSIWTWLEGDAGHLVTATSSQQFADLNLQAIGRYLYERAAFPQQPLMSVPNGRYPVLLPPIAAADLARTLGTLLTGENVLHALRPLRKRLNRAIATTVVTLIDDSTLPSGVKSRPIDDEGTATEATTLIEKGVLKTLLHTRQTAKQFGVPANGKATRSNLWAPPHSAPSNIYLQAGDMPPEALRQEIENGLLVTGILEPGGIQGVAGNFVMLVQGAWVKKGRVIGQVHHVRLSLNIFELLRNIRACGNDLEFSPLLPGAGAPTLLIESMQVG